MAIYYTYILATRSRTLTFGTTNNLFRRIGRQRAMDPLWLHSSAGAVRLVYYEEWKTAEAATLREGEFNRMPYGRLLDLIGQDNPDWRDLAAEWFIPRRA